MKRLLLQTLLLSFLFSGCASIPDEYLCVNLSESKCYCDKTLTSSPQIVDDDHPLNGQTCVDLRENSILMPVDSWIAIKKFILKVCKQNNNCQGVGDWNNKLDMLERKP